MDWKNGKTFSSQGILNRLEKPGTFTPNTGKVTEKNTGNVKEICQPKNVGIMRIKQDERTHCYDLYRF